MITSESKRIRVWDMRQSYLQGAAQTIENPDSTMLPSKAYALQYTQDKSTQQSSISKAYKMRYQSDKKRLIAHFNGAKGLFTFDMRKGRQIDYYDFHYYPI